MDDQQYVLRWHYHETAILSGLPKLLDSELLTDITLSAGCRNIKAHRVVLATCSSYFLQLFQDMGPLQHPVIVLQDTDYNDLNAIISFMYRGQCLVSEKQLPSVLAAAKLLQIRGLCDLKVPDTQTQLVEMKKLQKIMNVNVNDSTNQQYVIKDSQHAPLVTCDKQEACEIPQQHSPYESKPSSADNSPVSVSMSSKLMGVDIHSNAGTNTAEGSGSLPLGWKVKGGNNNNNNNNNSSSSKCFICGKYLSNQYNLRVHMETHEDGYHACASCPHVSRSRDALRKHISYRHPDETTSRKRKSKLDNI